MYGYSNDSSVQQYQNAPMPLPPNSRTRDSQNSLLPRPHHNIENLTQGKFH